MPLETAVQVFAIIHMAIVGLSHIVAHRAWAEFFLVLREKGHTGVFVVTDSGSWGWFQLSARACSRFPGCSY